MSELKCTISSLENDYSAIIGSGFVSSRSHTYIAHVSVYHTRTALSLIELLENMAM